MYTTHGFMTREDLADHNALYDTGKHPECPGHEVEDIAWPVYCSVNELCPDADDLEPL